MLVETMDAQKRWMRSGAPKAPDVMSLQDFVIISGSAPAVAKPAGARTGEFGAASMTDADQDELRTLLERMRQEHRDLDAAIEALHISPGRDLLQVQRLKKRKLVLRDRINQIEDQLTPDIIA
jgi:hypothetical protein